ncbi:monoacylglycerol lipase [Benincasa hispida]|uniref:monoacylglycerol lipase n=1 Tax=Benincasa hispida TaxID=102211 RepID=UPI001900569F|nr:monoacylglycerol lipase [Benincasa hispida]
MPMEPIVKGNPTVLSSSSSSSLILTSGASSRINALLSMRALKSLIMLVNAFILLLLLPFRGQKRAQDEKQERKCPTVRVPTTIVSWKSSSSNNNNNNANSSSSTVAKAVDQEVAVRRALAIQRVVEDKDKSEASVRDFLLFQSPRGNTIFTQSWSPVSHKLRGLVVLLHGLNEHSGRYSDFANQLNANGYKVFGMDWIGHGGSDGLHAYVHSLDDAVSDLKSYLQKVLADNPGLPCFLFGHSTGGAIVLKAVLDPSIRSCISGVVLTSPAVGVQPSHPIYAVLAPIVSLLFPRLQVGSANKTSLPVTRDPDALVAKYSDPLVYTGAIRVRTGYEILKISSYLQQNLRKISVPFLVLHGTADEVTDPTASQKLYDEASSTDKSIRLLQGLLHDLLFEPERQSIMKDIIDWMNGRL